jgi:hypothetical protein
LAQDLGSGIWFMGNVGGKIEKSGPSKFEDQAFSVF